MTTVTVRSLKEGSEGGTVVTLDNFRSWKRKCGKHTAFVVQMPPNVDGDGVLICTFADMNNKLPSGDYQAELVKRCAIPAGAKKELRGSDLWKCV